MKKDYLIIIFLVILVFLGTIIFLETQIKSDKGYANRPSGGVSNFEQCVQAGYPVLESYPRQCRADGHIFVEEVETEMENPEEKSLAEELAECLPKSDLASHEKCQELLNKIMNFEDCFNAGFSIMKSNPEQCETPDGRTFIKETNGTWEMAVLAVNNCEVENVFQTHSQVVALELKNGNSLTVIEPEIDDIFDVVLQAQDRCGEIPMATE